ncbi:hypothetical protein WA1_50740 [Scytonema hofmannii PCC 7110]|uniref:Lipoprotein n=1 Tax=Scytonema hofmannii PCC 7110 TaxID=128403 RepID=A0A139WQ02_9CYAN|nr:hypothetical protein [Scytonema hofmannii]KYC34509.1 hypothetical protein WA1_50740 [Scytonema hofmannii PCC 7110]
MKKYLILGLLFLLFGCSSNKQDSVSAEPSAPTPSVSSYPDNSSLSQALPNGLPNEEKLEDTDSENDLIDSFYFDGNGVKVGLTVTADRACYLYVRRGTPNKLGEVEIESFQREKPGLWRGYQTQRALTQPAGNKLNIYQNEELVSNYENNAISSEALTALKELKEREKSFKLLLRQDLGASDSARRVYTEQCSKLRNFYYREELPPLTKDEKRDFERSLEKSKQKTDDN